MLAPDTFCESKKRQITISEIIWKSQKNIQNKSLSVKKDDWECGRSVTDNNLILKAFGLNFSKGILTHLGIAFLNPLMIAQGIS